MRVKGKMRALTLGTIRVTGSRDLFRLGIPSAKWLLCWGVPLTTSRVALVILWYTGIIWEMGPLNTNEVEQWLCVWSWEISYVKISLI